MLLPLLLCFVQKIEAYGRVGHLLSGAIAKELLSAEGLSYLKSIIPEYDGDLARAALWGDEIKSDHSYDWAKSLHYINPVHDDPPMKCAYSPGPEDCPNNICVVTAIRNYTNQLIDQNGNKDEAFKFLIHFIGDLAQPLHATGRQRGGTQALARFDGRITNMHAIWDYKMFDKRIKDNFGGSFNQYVQFLVKKIAVDWRGDVPEWLSCPTPISAVLSIQNQNLMMDSSDIFSLVCPEKWAKESNQVNCESVWPNYKRKYELSGTYYEENILVEERLLAKASLRMAHIIDFLAQLKQ